MDKVKDNEEEKGKIIHTGQGKEEERRVCPCCGKGLILRTSKQNKNFGNKFYGCMGYPDCTYTESLEEYNRKRNLEEYLNNADYSFYCKNYNIPSNVSFGWKKKWF